MKVVYTAAALNDLDQIAGWLTAHYPAIAPAVERRIRAAVARLGRWPESARRSAKRQDVRVVPVGGYPYRIFYLITDHAVEILYIHHASRQPWDSKE
jgi:plasmid stabilization system protein ParE